MSKNKIVAVVGMCGSGKTVAVNEFEKRGWTKIYFGEATFIKMKELGLEINEENERKVREQLRASGDKGIYAKIFLPEIEKAFKKGNVVIESLYSWSEYKIVKEKFGDAFEVLCIATDAPLRRARLEQRVFRPMDKASSISRDYAEIENIEKGSPIGIADHYILNNTTISTFRKHVIKYINSL
ncbi:MAG: AAA family ATPase [Clostridia bacterium]|nr:AAA family ATPase [Clostridia bacterium]